MAIPSTLEELKDAILSRSLEDGMCESLQDVLSAASFEELVQAGIGYIRFSLQTGIMDDDMISAIDEDILNAAGIYTTGTPVITNPDKEIYLLRDVEATIDITSSGKYRINAYMQSKAVVNGSNQAFIRVKAFDDADIEVNQEDQILSAIHITNNANLEINVSGTGAANIISESASHLEIVTNNTSYTAVKMYDNSSANYTQNDTSQLIIYNYKSSTSTNLAV